MTTHLSLPTSARQWSGWAAPDNQHLTHAVHNDNTPVPHLPLQDSGLVGQHLSLAVRPSHSQSLGLGWLTHRHDNVPQARRLLLLWLRLLLLQYILQQLRLLLLLLLLDSRAGLDADGGDNLRSSSSCRLIAGEISFSKFCRTYEVVKKLEVILVIGSLQNRNMEMSLIDTVTTSLQNQHIFLSSQLNNTGWSYL